MQPNTLYFGDNLQVLRQHFPEECVDLVYLDPPFNSKRDYNYIYRGIAGETDTAQEQAFTDTWTMEGAAADFEEVTGSGRPEGLLVDALRRVLGGGSLVAYLAVMALRLRELHRVLRPTGSLYLHCDPSASHYLKALLDSIFGPANFRNEIVWRRTNAHNDPKRYGRVHDVLLYYGKTTAAPFYAQYLPLPAGHVAERYSKEDERGRYKLENPTGPGPRGGDSGLPWRGFDPTARNRAWAPPRRLCERLGIDNDLPTREKLERLLAAGRVELPQSPGSIPMIKSYLEDQEGRGVPLQDLWAYVPYTSGYYHGAPQRGVDQDVAWIGPTSGERLGYPTQKPLGLLERLIPASSAEGDLVLDPFCGCGTAVVAAQKLGRRWVGIDITSLAVNLIRERLADHWPEIWPASSDVPVSGLPKDVHGAQDLFAASAYDYQYWALSLVGAHPPGGVRRKGADKGVDGEIYWRDGQQRLQRAIVSVKGGAKVGDAMLKDLIATLESERAALGLFVTLAPPTRPMRERAALAGEYQLAGTTARFARVQILTIEELLAGRRPDLPKASLVEAHKQAAAMDDKLGRQGRLFGD